MAALTKEDFEAKYTTNAGGAAVFKDNTTGDISAGDMRDFADDIADSFFTVLQNSTVDATDIVVYSPTTLDFEGKKRRFFMDGEVAIGDAATWTLLNTDIAIEFKARFQIGGVTPSSCIQTFPDEFAIYAFSGSVSGSGLVGANVWTPAAAGLYSMEGWWDLQLWHVKIFGPIA